MKAFLFLKSSVTGLKLGAMTLLLIVLPSVKFAQVSFQQANFAVSCANCWPGWVEVIRPKRGVGPRIETGKASIFINGSSKNPSLNQEHLQFGSSFLRTNEVNVEFNFSNATIGGRLMLTDGNFLCLTPARVNAFVSDELFLITLKDTGNQWYGAFLGDFTLVDPEFSPGVRSSQAYTTVGLLEQRDSQLQVLTVKAIAQVTRFSLIRSRILLDESDPAAPTLSATFQFADGRREIVTSQIDPEQMISHGTAGIIYLVGNGSPCTGLTQREVAVRSFAVR
jgi:hypothetical protein